MKNELEYGVNPHQKNASVECDPNALPGTMGYALQHCIQGEIKSTNNNLNALEALECVSRLQSPACVITKHDSVCGASVHDLQQLAYLQAYRTNACLAHGGAIAFNHPVTGGTAREIVAKQSGAVDVIVAPKFVDDARVILATETKVCLLECGPCADLARSESRTISGMTIHQDCDTTFVTAEILTCVTQRKPTADEIANLLFAERVVASVKSNASVLAHDLRTVGIGVGGSFRIDAAEEAICNAQKINMLGEGCALAVQASISHGDVAEAAAKAGVTAIIQPGSVDDTKLIEICNQNNIAMVTTGIRHYKH